VFCLGKKIDLGVFESNFFSRRQNTPLDTIINVRQAGPSEAIFIARNYVSKSTTLFS
jgi:hypothetical protein